MQLRSIRQVVHENREGSASTEHGVQLLIKGAGNSRCERRRRTRVNDPGPARCKYTGPRRDTPRSGPSPTRGRIRFPARFYRPSQDPANPSGCAGRAGTETGDRPGASRSCGILNAVRSTCRNENGAVSWRSFLSPPSIDAVRRSVQRISDRQECAPKSSIGRTSGRDPVRASYWIPAK